MSKATLWPSLSVRMPAASTAVAWTKTSLPPPSGELKPYPFAVLKNLTVPTAMVAPHAVSARRHALEVLRDHRLRKLGCLVQARLRRVGGKTSALRRTDAVAA